MKRHRDDPTIGADGQVSTLTAGVSTVRSSGLSGGASHWTYGRCPCCRKKTEIVLGPLLNMTARGWNNLLGRAQAADLARAGTCPWCGRETTIVARILLGRFEPTLKGYAREGALL